MAKHNDLGKEGEKLAIKWFADHGYEILHCNWRHSHYEVDIIACKGKFLHFFEVKTRTSDRYGKPEESISKEKMMNLKNAAEEYQYIYPEWQYLQFNVIAIMLIYNREPEFFLIEDVYF